MRKLNKVLVLCLASCMLVGLTACGKKDAGTGMFEGADGSDATFSMNNNVSASVGGIGGKQDISVNEFNRPTDENQKGSFDNVNQTTVNQDNKVDEVEEEPYVEPEVVEAPMPTWLTDTSYDTSSLKKAKPDDEKNDLYYVDDMLYITIIDDEVKADDIDINFTYTYGSLQQADLNEKESDTHKIKDYILHLVEPMTYDDLVELQKELDSVSDGFKVEIKTANGLSSYVSEGIAESEVASNIQDPPKNNK